MGVLVQQLPAKGRDTADTTLVPVHIRGLLNEFFRRYDELQKLRQRELIWFILVLSFGFLCLTSLMFFSKPLLFFTLCLLFAFVLTLRQYLIVRNKSTHVYINVHILHHHLLGKLEVGLCEHDSACQCAENVKKYVWKKYRVSLYGDPV